MNAELAIEYLFDPRMRDMREEALERHELWAKHHELCEQCQQPWCDGICECDHTINCTIDQQLRVSWLDLIGNLWEMNRLEDKLISS